MNSNLDPVPTGARDNRITDREHIVFLVRVVETLLSGERQLVSHSGVDSRQHASRIGIY